MRIAVRAYAIFMLLYTGWRTYDFMLAQMPATDLSVYLALIFLFATEIGLLMWHEAGLSHITTYQQLHIATILMWLDFVGSLSAGVADMIIRQQMIDFVMPRSVGLALIYGLPLIVAANVAGALLFLSFDADTIKTRAVKMLNFEADRQALQELAIHKKAIVANRKKGLISDLTSNFDWIPRLGDTGKNTGKAPGAAASNNHKAAEDLPLNPTTRRRS
jgi:hypothetical protein